MGEVIEARRWRHPSGATASLSGAVPWSATRPQHEWELEVYGWTVKHPDGTTGLGKPPFETREAAQAWVDEHPNFKGMQQD